MSELIDRLDALATNIRYGCDEYHTSVQQWKTCRCDSDIATINDAFAEVLRLEEERDQACMEAVSNAGARELLRQERDALVEALKGLLGTEPTYFHAGRGGEVCVYCGIVVSLGGHLPECPWFEARAALPEAPHE